MSAGGLVGITDGVVTLRASGPDDAPILIAGRDDEWRRWMAPGDDDPRPTACIVVRDEVVGWVDFDLGHEYLQPGDVNVGYNVFAPHRGNGYATRAVRLLMHHLSLHTDHDAATLLIDEGNERSLAIARRLGFRPAASPRAGQLFFTLAVPPNEYSDGVVTIRRPRVTDLEADLEAKDEAQIRWLWLPGQRATWESMTPGEQRDHARRGLEQTAAAWGPGPKWVFFADTDDADYVVYVDCDLANEHVPAGEANVSYSAHPAHRGCGYVSRAVRLAVEFLRDHTGAREAHLVIDAENEPSLRVARAVGATETERWTSEQGRTMIRHVGAIDR